MNCNIQFIKMFVESAFREYYKIKIQHRVPKQNLFIA